MQFEYLNNNPSKRIAGDCAVRAIASAFELSWEDAMMELASMSCQTHVMPNDRKNTSAYIKSKGWTKHKGGKKLKDYRFRGTHLVACHYRNKLHLTYVLNGKVIDTWNPENLIVDFYYNPPIV